MPSNPSSTLTVQEVARELRLTTRSIYTLVAKGLFPRPLKIGGATRWRTSDLAAYLACGADMQAFRASTAEQTGGAMTDPKAILEALQAILESGQVTELRVLDAVTGSDRRPHVESGYFNDPEKMAAATAGIIEASGFYFVPNPVNPALLARAVNRIRNPGKKPTTADHDVTARRWLLIDCDPVRPAGISSSNDEHAAAKKRALAICTHLHDCGFPWPILADSGNGAHLMYRVDLPADDGGLIERCLHALAAKYDDETVKIDQTVFNSARMWKLYGTKAGKGDDTADRPHRMARILRVPEPLEVVPREVLEALAEQAPSRQTASTSSTAARGAIKSADTLKAYLEAHGQNVKAVKDRRGGGHVLILDGCPMNSDHGKAGDTAVVLLPSGIIGFECKHNGCANYKWSDVRAVIDSDHGNPNPQKPGAPHVKPEFLSAALVPSYRPFPLDALPEPQCRFVREVAKSTGTDPAFASVATLAVLAGCIGNRAAALVRGGWVEPAVLWGVLVGRSGTTKSPVLKAVTRPLVEFYKAEHRAYTEAMRQHRQELERYEARLAEWKARQRKGSPADPPDRPAEPQEKRVVVSDITVEKLGVLLQQNPRGLLLTRDELAAWIGSFDRYAAGGKGSDCPAWLSMYDAGSVTIDRKNTTGTIFCERAAVSVLGSIQPGTLARVFGTAEREAGLLARVLLAWPPDQPALWNEEALSAEAAESWHKLLSALLAIEPGVDDDGNLQPRYLPIDDEAKPIWIEWQNRHVVETAEIDDEDLAAHFAKLKGAVSGSRFVIECVKVATGSGGRAGIGADAMTRAIQIVEWFKNEARRLYGQLAESDEERDRRQLLECIQRHGGSVTTRDLMRAGRMFATADDAEAALAELVKAGQGQWDFDNHEGGRGRPTRRFRLTDTTDADTNPRKSKENGNCVSVDTVSSAKVVAGAGSDAYHYPPEPPPPEAAVPDDDLWLCDEAGVEGESPQPAGRDGWERGEL